MGKEWSSYYLTGMMWALTARVGMIEHHWGVLLARDTRGLSSYFWT